MATERLTYTEIGARLGVTAHAARALARRLHLPRQMNNDRKAVVLIDFAEIQHKPKPPPGRPDGEHVAVAVLKERVAALAAELAAERERSAGYHADLKRERERADHERDRANRERERADHERDRANRERERADTLAEMQLPALRSILETQDSMAGDVAVLRGLLERADHERDRANRERERADTLADLQLPAMRTILEAQEAATIGQRIYSRDTGSVVDH